MNKQQLIELLNATAVMVPIVRREALRVIHVLDDELYCVGEESGVEYIIELDDIVVNDYRFIV